MERGELDHGRVARVEAAAGHPAASGILRTVALQVCGRLRALETKLDRLLTGEGVTLQRELADAREKITR